MKCNDGWYFEAPQVNIRGDAAEKFLDQVLAAVTIYRQHLANEQWKEYNNTSNYLVCVKPFKSADKKKSMTTIIWQVNIEVQLTIHAIWITASIQMSENSILL